MAIIIIVTVIVLFLIYWVAFYRRVNRIGKKAKWMIGNGESYETVSKYLQSNGYTPDGVVKFIEQIKDNPDWFN